MCPDTSDGFSVPAYVRSRDTFPRVVTPIIALPRREIRLLDLLPTFFPTGHIPLSTFTFLNPLLRPTRRVAQATCPVARLPPPPSLLRAEGIKHPPFAFFEPLTGRYRALPATYRTALYCCARWSSRKLLRTVNVYRTSFIRRIFHSGGSFNAAATRLSRHSRATVRRESFSAKNRTIRANAASPSITLTRKRASVLCLHPPARFTHVIS